MRGFPGRAGSSGTMGMSIIPSPSRGLPAARARYSFSTSRSSNCRPSSARARWVLATRSTPLVPLSMRCTSLGTTSFEGSSMFRYRAWSALVMVLKRLFPTGCTTTPGCLSRTRIDASSKSTWRGMLPGSASRSPGSP